MYPWRGLRTVPLIACRTEPQPRGVTCRWQIGAAPLWSYAAMSVGNMAGRARSEGPAPQIVCRSIEELLARGSERGYVTYDELAPVPLDLLSGECLNARTWRSETQNE